MCADTFIEHIGRTFTVTKLIWDVLLVTPEMVIYHKILEV